MVLITRPGKKSRGCDAVILVRYPKVANKIAALFPLQVGMIDGTDGFIPVIEMLMFCKGGKDVRSCEAGVCLSVGAVEWRVLVLKGNYLGFKMLDNDWTDEGHTPSPSSHFKGPMGSERGCVVCLCGALVRSLSVSLHSALFHSFAFSGAETIAHFLVHWIVLLISCLL